MKPLIENPLLSLPCLDCGATMKINEIEPYFYLTEDMYFLHFDIHVTCPSCGAVARIVHSAMVEISETVGIEYLSRWDAELNDNE